jgi:fermentation-respiration switch protein FrsA (DUF1100 family)
MARRRSKLQDIAAPLLAGGAAIVALESFRRAYRLHQLFEPSRQPEISWDPRDYGIGVAPASSRQDAGVTHDAEELSIETPDGETLHAWYCRAPHPIASALYCHGSAGNLTTVAHVVPSLLEAGVNVLLFDYRGYGKSSGTPSVAGVMKDVAAAARVHDRIRPHDKPSILYGYSLGGALAAQSLRDQAFCRRLRAGATSDGAKRGAGSPAGETCPFDGVILQSTFTNLPDITRFMWPRLPLHLVSGKLFDTLSVVRELRLPVLFIHGDADETCPSAMSQTLHDACASGRKRIVIVGGGMHKDLYRRDPDSLVWAVNRFVTEIAESGVIASAAR